MTADKKPLYLYLMCYVEDKMYPHKLVSIKKYVITQDIVLHVLYKMHYLKAILILLQ